MVNKMAEETPGFLLRGGESLGNVAQRCGYRVFRTGSKIKVLETISYGYVSLMPALKPATEKDLLQLSRVIRVGKRAHTAYIVTDDTLDLMNLYLKNGGAMALFFMGADLYFYLERGAEKRITRANPYSWEIFGGGPTIDTMGMSIPVYPLPHKTIFNYGVEGYHRIDFSPSHSIYVLATRLSLGKDLQLHVKKLDEAKEFIDQQDKTIPFTTNYVKTLRDTWGLSLRDVEDRGGTPKSTVAHLEKLGAGTTRKSTLYPLATALGVAPEELLEPVDQKKVE